MVTLAPEPPAPVPSTPRHLLCGGLFLLEELLLLGGPLERLHVLISGKGSGGGLIGGLDSAGGILDVPLDGDGATAARDLDHVVGVVRDSHELCVEGDSVL